MNKNFTIIIPLFLLLSCNNGRTSGAQSSGLANSQTNVQNTTETLTTAILPNNQRQSQALSLKKSYIVVDKGDASTCFDMQYMQYLKSLEGKYPFEIDELYEQKPDGTTSLFRSRLLGLLGKDRLEYLLTYCDVSSPIEVRDGWIIMDWMKPHEADRVYFTFVLDTENNNAYVLSHIQEDEGAYSNPGDWSLIYESEDGLKNMPDFIRKRL